MPSSQIHLTMPRNKSERKSLKAFLRFSRCWDLCTDFLGVWNLFKFYTKLTRIISKASFIERGASDDVHLTINIMREKIFFAVILSSFSIPLSRIVWIQVMFDRKPAKKWGNIKSFLLSLKNRKSPCLVCSLSMIELRCFTSPIPKTSSISILQSI